MSDKSKIPWTQTTWDLTGGCTKASDGCERCYALKLVGTRLANNPVCKGRYEGLVKDGNWTGKIKLFEDRLDKPRHWRKPRKIFLCPYSDLFHPKVPFEFIDKVIAIIALCPQHTFQILTKRAERMAEYCMGQIDGLDARTRVAIILEKEASYSLKPEIAKHHLAWFNMRLFPLPNLIGMVTAENQPMADERIPYVLQCGFKTTGVSVEPMLGPVDLKLFEGHTVKTTRIENGKPCYRNLDTGFRLSWVIIGPENGPGKRPFKIKWARDLVAQCDAAGVPVFIKPSRWLEWPDDLKDRQEYPKCTS